MSLAHPLFCASSSKEACHSQQELMLALFIKRGKLGACDVRTVISRASGKKHRAAL